MNTFENEKVNDFSTECVEDFFYGFTINSKIKDLGKLKKAIIT